MKTGPDNRRITDDKQLKNNSKRNTWHMVKVSSNPCTYEAAKWIESYESDSLWIESDIIRRGKEGTAHPSSGRCSTDVLPLSIHYQT